MYTCKNSRYVYTLGMCRGKEYAVVSLGIRRAMEREKVE